MKFSDPTGLQEKLARVSTESPNQYPGVPTSVIPYLEQQKERTSLYKDMNQKLAEILVSYIGTEYELGGFSTEGIDCSGLLGKALNEMGYNINRSDVYTSLLSSGDVDWIGLYPSASDSSTGNLGMLNFYKVGDSKSINHMDYGIGTTNTPLVLLSPKKQIIDATEGDTMLCRNGRLGQYIKAETHAINQTYAPFSTKTKVSVQGYIKWEILDSSYKKEENEN